MKILVANDDGVHSEGLHALVGALRPLGDITVVAPDRERSAVAHSLTFFNPIRLTRISEEPGCVVYSTDGTPTDCVLMGIFGLEEGGPRPDLVVSGINRGANLGDDMHYSGTVSAAMEGCIHGVPAFAVSLATFKDPLWETAAAVALKVAESVREHPLPPRTFLNVNVPNVPLTELKGIVPTVQGASIYQQRLLKRHDPRGNEYYWLTGAIPRGEPTEGTDFAAVMDGKASVTPVQLNLTSREFLAQLSSWKLFA